MRTVVCERCNTEFSCLNSDKCWCASLPYVRYDLTNKYNNCLCKECLKELYNETSKNNNQG